MANLNQPTSFKIVNPEIYKPTRRAVTGSYAGKAGDVYWIDSNGHASSTPSGIVGGIQTSSIIDGLNGIVNTTASSTNGEDYILGVEDPGVEFIGQIASGADTDPYTTRSSAACFDIAGSAGVQYVNQAASTNDNIKVVRTAYEPDTGLLSAVGAYQKKVFRFNPATHFLGTIA